MTNYLLGPGLFVYGLKAVFNPINMTMLSTEHAIIGKDTI